MARKKRTATTTRRRAATSTPTTAKRTKPAKLELPALRAGERYWVLEAPYEDRGLLSAAGARWYPDVRAAVWIGPRLPASLAPYRTRPYTLERLLEDTLNGTRAGGPAQVVPMRPRPAQVAGARAIALHAAAGRRQFLLADEPGTGKTITTILAAKAVCALRKGSRVLVIADRPAAITIGHWARSISGVGDGGLTWLVTTWDRLDKIKSAKWDVVIADEAHRVRHTTTKRWGYYRQLVGFARKTRVPYVIATTATPSHTPLEMPYLAAAFADARGGDVKAWADELPAQLAAAGIHMQEERRYGLQWTEDARERAADIARVRGWLVGQQPPAMLFRPAPQGPPEINALPVTLGPARRLQYEAEWGEFCAQMRLARRGRDKARGRAALIRFRQKGGLLRVDDTVQWVAAQVEAGRQVAVSVQYVDTAADPLREALQDLKIPVACIYSTGRFDQERERMRFQTGKAPVVVFTPTASISLHSGELLSGGVKGTSAPRVGLFHQARYSGIEGRQVVGRTHRDNVRSPWWMAYAENTVEERVCQVMVERFAMAADTVGGDTTMLAKIAKLLDADWLPSADLTED